MWSGGLILVITHIVLSCSPTALLTLTQGEEKPEPNTKRSERAFVSMVLSPEQSHHTGKLPHQRIPEIPGAVYAHAWEEGIQG